VDGEEQGVAGGDQGQRITPAAEEPGEAEQGEQRRLRKKGDELICGLICKFRERQGPYCKGLATFKPMLK
jgi:hypothetical protein